MPGLTRTNSLLILGVLFHLGLLPHPSPAFAELDVSDDDVAHWALHFGNTIRGIVETATGVVNVKANYLLLNPRVRPIKGRDMIRDMKEKMQTMLNQKVQAVKRLVREAEIAQSKHDEDPELQLDYPKAKDLNTTVFSLESNEHFNYIPVNLNKSTVHVPTNVYDESSEVVNGVQWSESLDKVFKQNYEIDPTLTWQYFGSSSGFFRNYPGIKWTSPGVDMYDCRTRGWYIQAATSPKDIVILLDASGSMTGLRMSIARSTVEKILDTLSDDDFFNVIKFSSYPEYVDDCFNMTLVQANADNKKRVKEALRSIKTRNIAQFEPALEEAFQLLRMVNESGSGAQCNRAIMIITDGAPENYEKIFEKYNWPQKDVRVFTFLIGREVSDSKQVTWMACANKGYFSHISTIADVHENVQDYIHVLSRPMAILRANRTIWTSVYVDEAHDLKGLNLMTSVAHPVFNISSETGILLGVMGTDVPLKELTKITPQYKLGVNGYAFATTNNGYILFHPDFRPMKDNRKKPNYNSVDLSEVELSDEKGIDDSGIPTPNYNIELRKNMVDRKSGGIEMDVKMHYDNMRRVLRRKNHYFYTPLEGTPFSLGIALPDKYGIYWVDGRRKLEDADIDEAMFNTDVKLAPWNYCKMDTNESLQDPIQMLHKYLKYGKRKSPEYEKRCDNDLIESLLWDIHASTEAHNSWVKENRDGVKNTDSSRESGIELVFMGTKGGLTRYLQLVDNLTDPYFLEKNTSTIEEMYYKRAVDNGENTYTFSVPYKAGASLDGPILNNTVITVSTPIMLDNDKDEKNSEEMAAAAVMGLQMRYDKFYDFFMTSTMACVNDNCDVSCLNESIDCFLLDENGFIILSEDLNEVGEFYGEIDATLMKELIIEHPGSQRGVYERIELYDFQGLCDIWKKGSGSSANSIFMDPLKKILLSFWWMMQQTAMFLAEFNFFSWWNDNYARGDQLSTMESNIRKLLDNLADYGDEDQLEKWRNELLVSGLVDYTNEQEVEKWFNDIKEKHGYRKVGEKACILQLSLFTADFNTLPQTNKITKCGICTKSYTVHMIPKTNMMLLVVDSNCNCIIDQPIKIDPVDIENTDNDTLMCHRLQTEIYRRRPPECYASHPDELTEQQDCGGAGHRQLGWMLLMVIPVFITCLQSKPH